MTDARERRDEKTSTSPAPGAEPAPPASSAVPLLEPREGIPPVTADPAALDRVVAAFAGGTGPVAVDAERASGYRYGQRAYLVQLRRQGSGTALIDPVACPDLTSLNAALGDAEWVLHAANQDLPCLDELGLHPARLFDTELAGRLAGFAKVGLGTMVEQVLGFLLEKGHSAVDWSTRPLPEPWLRYAALDVELLVDLRDALEDELGRQGKLEWAHQEFASIALAPPPARRTDPWRRTSGVHKVRRRRQLAAVRELWNTRDRIARQRDLSPGRVLPDAAIIAAAQAMPKDTAALQALPGWGQRMPRGRLEQWQGAVERARMLPEAGLPPATAAPTGPPPPRSWSEKDPQAAARLAAAKAAVAALAEERHLPAENLIAPDLVRRVAWAPPASANGAGIAEALDTLGARQWQVQLVAPVLAQAFTSPA
ncbi:ribonuclease D [Mangrovactinospora gilvigrisea]|uniref:Ribonuclease D n=1 Tax=Mangrovactinospora gilvigrisea TaxID=1428644 RepID=A0A1J7BAC2_9ACTN|nr:HRDC domain-containing protein [Mangrovactinospora gilvigrisea]OIV35566.1 ribonuclease D [Mangrovactinospora gilvigrisea]